MCLFGSPRGESKAMKKNKKNSKKVDLTDLISLVDEGYELDQKIKDLNDELDEIKTVLKKAAKEAEVKEIRGTDAVAKFKASSGTNCGPRDFHDEVVALEMEDDVFYDNVKVLVGEAKKALGTVHFDGISEPWSIPYNVIQFVEKK